MTPSKNKRTWQVMKDNHYQYISLGGLLMLIAWFIFPALTMNSMGEQDPLGMFAWLFISTAIFLLAGIGGWIACRNVVNQENRDSQMKNHQ